MRISRKRLLWACLILVVLFGALLGRRALRDRVDAIPARGGEIFTTAPLPTIHYLQKDARWENDTVGGTGERLARVGCTVCSLAMALDYYGLKTTPKELNDFLKQNDGYTLRGWLKWNAVSSFSGGKVAMDYIGAPTHVRIDRALKNNQPVIAKVFINGIIPHWVLIVGKEGDDYLMRDPLGDGNAVQRLSEYGSEIYAMRTLRRTDRE